MREKTDINTLQTNTGRTIQKPLVRTILALISCALWGSAFPCVKIGYEWFNVEGSAGQILFAGYRFFLAGVITLFIASIIERRIAIPSRKAAPHVFCMGVIQIGIQYFFFYIGLSTVTGSVASIIDATSSFIAIVFAHFLIKGERMNTRKVAGCILGLAGVVILNSSGLGGESSYLGELFIFISAVTYAFSSVYTKKIAHLISPVALTAYSLLIGGALLTICGLICGGEINPIGAKAWVLLVYMALISVGGFSIWTVLLKYNPVSKITIFAFSIPVFGVLLSSVFLGESFLYIQNMLALVLVSVGIIVVDYNKAEDRAI